jgi:hypothetical protein
MEVVLGRPRTPSKVLEFTGAYKKNPARRTERAAEPAAKSGLGAPPSYFDAADRACWEEIKRVVSKGVHTRMDRPSAELIARLWARFRGDGLGAAETRILARLMGRHGLSPSERTRVLHQ